MVWACWIPPRALNPVSPGTFLVDSAVVGGLGTLAGVPAGRREVRARSTTRKPLFCTADREMGTPCRRVTTRLRCSDFASAPRLTCPTVVSGRVNTGALTTLEAVDAEAGTT